MLSAGSEKITTMCISVQKERYDECGKVLTSGEPDEGCTGVHVLFLQFSVSLIFLI